MTDVQLAIVAVTTSAYETIERLASHIHISAFTNAEIADVRGSMGPALEALLNLDAYIADHLLAREAAERDEAEEENRFSQP